MSLSSSSPFRENRRGSSPTRDSSPNRRRSPTRDPETPLVEPLKGSLFNHYYIIHNINLLWKNEVRNTIFKLFDLQSKALAIKFFLSNNSNRIVKDLITSVSNRVVEEQEEVRSSPKSDSISPKRPNNSKVGVFDSAMAQDLLERLIREKEVHFFVSNESLDSFNMKLEKSKRQSSANPKFSMAKQFTYFASKDLESPDYILPGRVADSDSIWLLINPQINFETKFGQDGKLQCAVIAAENMELQSINICESDFDGEKDEAIAKFRKILNIHNAQFFISRSIDIETIGESDIDNIVIHRSSKTDPEYRKPLPWPIWVPIECLVDHTSHTGYLQRVMERFSASCTRDKHNTLHVNRTTSSTKNSDHADSYHVRFPTFVISVNAAQYSVVFDVVTKLIIYRDPQRGARNDRRKKMVIGLETLSNLTSVVDTVFSLQGKIRQAETLLKYRRHHKSTLIQSNDQVEGRLEEIHKLLVRHQDELYVLMESLKELLNASRKKDSVEVAWRLNVRAGKLVWNMMLDNGESLCNWVFDMSSWMYSQNEDQSSSTKLEIDRLRIENCLPSSPAGFKELLSPYAVEKRILDYSKHKLLRIYWRERSPVAGIQVVEHFEINLIPIRLNMTYDVAKQLVYYIFPEKKAAKVLLSSDTADDDGEAIDDNDDIDSPKTRRRSTKEKVDDLLKPGVINELLQMQNRARDNKSFIYIKVPDVQLCLSYRVNSLNLGSKRA